MSLYANQIKKFQLLPSAKKDIFLNDFRSIQVIIKLADYLISPIRNSIYWLLKNHLESIYKYLKFPNLSQLNHNHYKHTIQLQSLATRFMHTNSYIAIYIIFTALFACSHSTITIADTHIATDRNQKRTDICTFYSANYTNSQIESSKAYINQYHYLTNEDIELILFDNNYTKLKTQTILIIMPHLITFIVFSVIWIPLCCCCTWPEKHPICRKCKKPEKEMYGKCELKWSAYCSIILYLAVILGGIFGIIKGVNFVYYFNDVGCKTIAVADDTLHGRISPTVENRFFVGLSPFSTDLASFNSSFNTIWTQNENCLYDANLVRSRQTFFQSYLQTIYTSYTDPTYSNAFSSDGTTYTNVNSQFKSLYYGPSNNSNTVLGKIYNVTNNIFNQINAILDPMITAYNNLAATTKPTVQIQMTDTITSIGTFSTNLQEFISKWAKIFSNKTFFNQLILLLKAFYGAFFVLAILGFLGAIVLACCSVVKVRLIMYFACSSLFVLAFLSFPLLIFTAALAPNVSQICGYIDIKLSTGAGTKDFFSRLGFNTMGDFFQNCMSDGTGWMMDQIGPTFNSSFADLLLITQKVQNFNPSIPSYSTANLIAPFTTGTATVTKVRDAKLLDVNDTIALNFISGVRLVSYSIDVSCNTLRVQGDSWMPSYDLYSCPGGKAQNNPCLDLSSTGTCALGCFEIMNQFQSSSGDASFATTLAARYNSNTCNYYKYITNLEYNWNIPRKNSINTVLSNLANLETKITDYDNTFKGTQANISTYDTILTTNYNELTSLTVGTFNGLDCRVLGESIIDMRNSVCVGVLNSIYYNLICLILVSYGTLLAACCTVCAGVRHFRHLQKMQIHVGYKGVPVSISDTKIFQK